MTTKKRALDVQEGGNHYKKMPIQPVEYCYHNKLGVCESNIIKYVTRWRDKNGIQDLEKARHYIDLLIEFAQAEQVTESDWPSEEYIESVGRNGNDGEVIKINTEVNCWCEDCNVPIVMFGQPSEIIEEQQKDSLCQQCGDKRCERAKHHDNECSAKKKYRDLEKPETWKRGDLVTVEFDDCTFIGEFAGLNESGSGVDLIRSKCGPKSWCSLSNITSVEARS